MIPFKASLFGAAGGGGGASFSPSDLGSKLLAWWEVADNSTLTKAGGGSVTATGQSVSAVSDKSGNGHSLSAINGGAAANSPTYQQDGSGNYYLLFDGTNDAMLSYVPGSLPFDRLTAVQQVTWVGGDYIWYSNGTNSAGGLNQYSAGGSPKLRLFDGTLTNVLQTSDLAVGANGVVTERHIAAGSKLAVDNNAYATADAGSSTPGTIYLGGSVTGSVASNIRFYAAVVCDGTLTATDIANLRTYLGSKCGVTL